MPGRWTARRIGTSAKGAGAQEMTYKEIIKQHLAELEALAVEAAALSKAARKAGDFRVKAQLARERRELAQARGGRPYESRPLRQPSPDR